MAGWLAGAWSKRHTSFHCSPNKSVPFLARPGVPSFRWPLARWLVGWLAGRLVGWLGRGLAG
eukprot:6429214-Alexandrium_andersonii.AAC.1